MPASSSFSPPPADSSSPLPVLVFVKKILSSSDVCIPINELNMYATDEKNLIRELTEEETEKVKNEGGFV